MRQLLERFMRLDESFVKTQERLKKLSMDELVALGNKIRNDPKSKNPSGGSRPYTKAVMKKLEDIGWAITYKIQQNKKKK